MADQGDMIDQDGHIMDVEPEDLDWDCAQLLESPHDIEAFLQAIPQGGPRELPSFRAGLLGRTGTRGASVTHSTEWFNFAASLTAPPGPFTMPKSYFERHGEGINPEHAFPACANHTQIGLSVDSNGLTVPTQVTPGAPITYPFVALMHTFPVDAGHHLQHASGKLCFTGAAIGAAWDGSALSPFILSTDTTPYARPPSACLSYQDDWPSFVSTVNRMASLPTKIYIWASQTNLAWWLRFAAENGVAVEDVSDVVDGIPAVFTPAWPQVGAVLHFFAPHFCAAHVPTTGLKIAFKATKAVQAIRQACEALFRCASVQTVDPNPLQCGLTRLIIGQVRRSCSGLILPNLDLSHLASASDTDFAAQVEFLVDLGISPSLWGA